MLFLTSERLDWWSMYVLFWKIDLTCVGTSNTYRLAFGHHVRYRREEKSSPKGNGFKHDHQPR
uniref:Uncharacterized protein n=1 Tax=Anguilla anguilla TaxID=7936 RepID=A0A0E9Y0X7_ANGAN